MKVRMLVCQAGADFVREARAVYDVPDAEALRLIASGQAEPVRKREAETAVPPSTGEHADK
jgi:hypothetical protein